MAKGFLFEARQKRFTFDEQHFFVDLVFYNRLLQCYVLIDLKIDKLTHQDLGQMQMYVNYYDRYVKQDFEKPTIGILLCREKNDALVELTLPKDTNIYASAYQLYLPNKALLQAKVKEWIEEFEENEDATVYTVTLREDAKWSDGTPITAEDVVYSFQRVVDPSFASPKANDYFYLKNAEAIIKGEKDKQELGVKALDDYTVEFVLEKPVDFFVDCLKTPGWAPIQKEAGEKYQDLYGAEPENMVFPDHL